MRDSIEPGAEHASALRFGDAQLTALYVRLEKRLFNVVYRWVWDRSDAQDVVQEAFVKLWSMRERVRPETVDALVWRIALNIASNRRRRHRFWRMVGLDSVVLPAPRRADGDMDERLMTQQTQRQVRAAVDALPEAMRQVLVMGELSGLTQREIAAVLDVPEGTVASRRHQAAKRLRTALRTTQEGAPQ